MCIEYTLSPPGSSLPPVVPAGRGEEQLEEGLVGLRHPELDGILLYRGTADHDCQALGQSAGTFCDARNTLCSPAREPRAARGHWPLEMWLV